MRGLVSCAVLAVLIAIVRSVPFGVAAQAPTTSQFDVMERDIDGIQAAIERHGVTCRGVVTAYLRRIEAYNRRGPNLNAVETINPQALEDAARLDAAAEPRGPLHCVPVLVKDQLNSAGLQTTYGSKAFKGFIPGTDATVVRRLRAAGAIVIAKATMGEFASGYVSSVSGPIRNPYNLARHPSGSSGGTGSGMAANFAAIGIGEDTGGSIRGPASAGSLVGLRPTLQLVSRAGLFPARPSMDTVGPITRTVKDAALVMDVIAGPDPDDPITNDSTGKLPGSYAQGLTSDGLRGARLGVLGQPQDTGTDVSSPDYQAIHAVSDEAIARMRQLGAVAEELPLIPDLAKRLDQTHDEDVFETESAVDKFLARQVNPPFKTFREILLSGYLVPSRARALIDSVNRTTDDAGYARQRKEIDDLKRRIVNAMQAQRLDAIVYPTADLPPALIAADVMTNPRAANNTRLGSNRRLASVLGFPAITIPAGFTPDGMPVGIELLGQPFTETQLLKFAYAYEQATHHRKVPSTTPNITQR